MFLRKYWLPLSVFSVAIVIVCVYMLQTRLPQEPIKVYKSVEVEQPTANETTPKVREAAEGVHFHTDPHNQPKTEPTKTGDISRNGHWSDAYLPPMEELEVKYAGDPDAMFILERVKILLKHEREGIPGHNPAVDKAFAELMNFTNKQISSLGTEVSESRLHELLKLTWPTLDNPPSSVIFENEGRIIE